MSTSAQAVPRNATGVTARPPRAVACGKGEQVDARVEAGGGGLVPLWCGLVGILVGVWGSSLYLSYFEHRATRTGPGPDDSSSNPAEEPIGNAQAALTPAAPVPSSLPP